MRLRIQTKEPLPELKAWYTPDGSSLPATVLDLKQAICHQVSPLKVAGVSGRHIVLLLEGFELLDDSPLGVVRDGDLINIESVAQQDEKCGHKRKRSEPSVFIPGRSVRPSRSRPNPNQQVDSGSDSPDDSAPSSSSSSSPSSCSSSSSNTSDSATSSSSSSSSPPLRQPLQRLKGRSIPKPDLPSAANVSLNGPFVPPGFGKVQTHKRNLRRRLKRKYNQQPISGPTPTPPKNTSSVNLLPLGDSRPVAKRDRHGPAGDVAKALNNAFETNAGGGEICPGMFAGVGQQRGSGRPPVTNEAPEIMMATLRNKNKKKGFKQAMAGPLPAKIVFDDIGKGINEMASSHANQAPHAEAPSSLPSQHVQHARLVAPSEKQERGELPLRMFVTSVDVEAGMWDKGSQKKKRRVEKHVEGNGEQGTWHDEAFMDTCVENAAQSVLVVSNSETSAGKGSLDWDRAEKDWDNLLEVRDVGQLAAGTLVGWKALALNPQTFSPEMLLSAASVVQLPDPDSQHRIVVRRLTRPCSSEAFLSFGLMESEEEEEHTWSDILSLKWRIITI